MIIFLASIHKSLSVISLNPKSKALSLIVMTAGNVVGGVGTGADGLEDELPRTEPASGCARGIKAGVGDRVAEMLKISSGTNNAPPTHPWGVSLQLKLRPP